MASSRWKRFAFFERQQLVLPTDVQTTLLGGSAASQSLRSLERTSAAHAHGDVLLRVTTAALPSNGGSTTTLPEDRVSTALTEDPLAAMWQSLTACHAVAVPATTSPKAAAPDSVAFPPTLVPSTTASNSSQTTALDGLVLAWLVRRDGGGSVHCVDVTLRCNPPLSAAGTEHRELEDLDGWRGSVSPLSWLPTSTTATTTTTGAQGGADESLVDIALCRVPPRRNSASTGARGSNQRPNTAIAASNYSPLHMACLSSRHVMVVEDPHLCLTCRLPDESTTAGSSATKGTNPMPSRVWSTSLPPMDGKARVVAVAPGLVAVGTSTGVVLVYAYSKSQNGHSLRQYLRIPPPPTEGHVVVTVHLSTTGAATTSTAGSTNNKANVFVTYDRPASATADEETAGMATAGLCCYEFPLPLTSTSSATLSAPSARHDLDGRHVGAATLVDRGTTAAAATFVTVARPDGLYSYSPTERVAVAPIDGPKLCMTVVPAAVPAVPVRDAAASGLLVTQYHQLAGYALVASTDAKSGRDAVDIYDATNKLVAFHFLLSPGHKALQAAGVTTAPSLAADGSWKGGRSSALVLTSGGSLVTLTEKLTHEKVDLLVQKNLYAAAIVVAFADPSFAAAEITQLYRQFAEHLYLKGDFSAAMDQYLHTLGVLESSHVIFRYLDAPKIPLLVKYLERLRAKHLATAVHNELLRTCYLKLNDTKAAEALSATAGSASSVSRSLHQASLSALLSNLSNNPKEALATICTLEAHQAAEVLVIHGVSLARAMPRETAGVVIALCVGTYSPRALAGLSTSHVTDLKKMVEYATDDRPPAHDPYPVELFASAFLEHPKLLRLILAHCNRNKCPLPPSLRRTLLELTLDEWNQSKRTGDTEAQKLRYKEAIASLTDSHCRDIGEYDALVIVQLAGFAEGELILYERLQMTPMLLERYAAEGSEKSRRQMLALCQSDPEVLADVLGHLVQLASTKLSQKRARQEENTASKGEKDHDDDEVEEILEDIQEALALAKRQAVLPPVRIARILAGEGTGQFSGPLAEEAANATADGSSIPLSVALDYVGTILEESRQEITRLKSEVEDYNELCNSMETEIDSLLRSSHALPKAPEGGVNDVMASRLNIDEVYWRVLRAEEGDFGGATTAERPLEAFWRDLTQSEDSFDTIARYFAKGVMP